MSSNKTSWKHNLPFLNCHIGKKQQLFLHFLQNTLRWLILSNWYQQTLVPFALTPFHTATIHQAIARHTDVLSNGCPFVPNLCLAIPAGVQTIIASIGIDILLYFMFDG
jgi:hypothetical protein